MKGDKLLELALGIITSVGGYLDVGAIATAATAGALFGFAHLWAIALGTVLVIFLVEMAGRFAAVSKHTVRAAMRERLGANYFAWTYTIENLVNVIALASQIGGIALAVQLLTGTGYRVWAVPVAVVLWALLWFGTFKFLENGVSLLGLVTLAFVVAAWKLHPPMHDVARGFLPHLAPHDPATYWFLAISIVGSIVQPYLLFFYSSGAVEDKWDASYIPVNRGIATLGMTFGGLMDVGVLVVAAMVLHPRGIGFEQYEQAGLMLTPALGRAGFFLFAFALGIAGFGACLESGLSIAYELAQSLGWNWGESVRPRKASRFTLTYTIAIVLAVIPIVLGVPPLEITMLSMALTAVILPVALLPFLTLMNDPELLGRHVNGRIANAVVILVSLLAGVLAVVTIPLEYFGG